MQEAFEDDVLEEGEAPHHIYSEGEELDNQGDRDYKETIEIANQLRKIYRARLDRHRV